MAKVNIEACGISIVINTEPKKTNDDRSSEVCNIVKKSVEDAIRKHRRQSGSLYTGRGKL